MVNVSHMFSLFNCFRSPRYLWSPLWYQSPQEEEEEEVEDKPRPTANAEDAPQESADPAEAEKPNDPPPTEAKRWAQKIWRHYLQKTTTNQFSYGKLVG